MRTVSAVAGVLGVLVAGSAAADCRYCGRSVVCVGDSAVKLAEACGEPVHRQPVGGLLSRTFVERLSYRLDSNRITSFTVDAGKITTIEEEFTTD